MSIEMLLIVCIVLLILALSTLAEPTLEEIKQGFVVSPIAMWGQQAREQNCLKVLCIGGSNTAHLYDGFGYVNLLEKFLKTNISEDKYFQENSYTINRGVSGRGVDFFTGKKFDFELKNESSWPNVVIVDTSVNMPNVVLIGDQVAMQSVGPKEAMILLERLLRSFVYKYKLRNLPCPDFVFFNMPHLKTMFDLNPPLKTAKERAKYAEGYRKIPGILDFDAEIKHFATFYRIPVISYGEATFPDAIRHFIASSFQSTPWPYSVDGVHMAPPVGTSFAVDWLLGPLLKEGVRPRAKESALFDLSRWPRLYPPGPILQEVSSYSSYSYEINSAPLTEVIHDLNHSQWQVRTLQHSSYCFGSTKADTVGELRIRVPPQCSEENPCRVLVSLLHSWNASYVGKAQCDLDQFEPHRATHLVISKLIIDGQFGVKNATHSVRSQFPVNVTEGQYTVRCINLLENKLSCITALEINSIIIV